MRLGLDGDGSVCTAPQKEKREYTMGCLSITAVVVLVFGVLIALFPPPDVLSGLNSNHDHGPLEVNLRERL